MSTAITQDRYYADFEAEHQRREAEKQAQEDALDKVAAEILVDPQLFDGACGEFEELRERLMASILKLQNTLVLFDHEQVHAIGYEIKRLSIDIAWAYAPMLMALRESEI